MGDTTAISWCDHTFNPWVGCQRVSPGCEHCYAEAYDQRWNDGRGWGPKGERRVTSDANWRGPVKWNREAAAAGVRRRVFCASLADVFEDRPELAAPRARLWKLIHDTTDLNWLLLTKRPENADRLAAGAVVDAFDGSESMLQRWPRNVWLGTTAEDQQRADERIPVLLSIGGPAVRFVSYEPALGLVDFTQIREPLGDGMTRTLDVVRGRGIVAGNGDASGWGREPRLDWIIVGGESGSGARPFDLAWARSTVQQCKAAGVACFVKQLGARLTGEWQPDVGKILTPEHLRDRAGADPSEWPTDLRVQEWPLTT